MFIGCKAKPKFPGQNKTTHSVYGKAYVFRDLNNDGHFIAAVDNEEHIAVFLEGPAKDSFYAYDARPVRPSAPLTRAPALGAEITGAVGVVTAPSPAPAPAPSEESSPESAPAPESSVPPDATLDAFPPASREEAAKLLEGPVNTLSTRIGKVSGLVVVSAALLLERERKGGARESVADILQRTLDLSKA
jgi:hypothetical protein